MPAERRSGGLYPLTSLFRQTVCILFPVLYLFTYVYNANDDMGGTCSTHRGDGKCVHTSGLKIYMKERGFKMYA
jgi:hypothetical protein